ncbi:hypothetical protein GN244_ATG16388 [Phytophthora infestans]|uniref:Uncharacterized protein n=1 Tax=Phytophthora infestans TaxID=4787 RepID=A0A833W7G3_PHYIN|nr:hypothetical protein GN244_ATG16388 [Phytophthora infestans]
MLDTLDLEGGNYVADDGLKADSVGATSLSARYASEAQGESTTVDHDVCERERSKQTLTAEVDGTEAGATISDAMTSKTATKTSKTGKTAAVGQSETCEQCCTKEKSGLVEQNPSRTGACDTQDTGVCDGNESTTVL